MVDVWATTFAAPLSVTAASGPAALKTEVARPRAHSLRTFALSPQGARAGQTRVPCVECRISGDSSPPAHDEDAGVGTTMA